MSRLLFKYPSRGRPVWFIKTLDLYLRLLSGKHECEFLIAMDTDDETMCNDIMADYLDQIDFPPDSNTKLTWYWRDHQGKVDAVNSCISAHDFDVVTVISDDVEPQEKDYDDIIATAMKESFPDLNGIIYFDDGRTHERVVSIPVIGKPMFTSLGHISHPDFIAWGDKFVTDEFMATGKVKYFPRVLLKHIWRKYGVDKTYERAAYYRHIDKVTYRRLLNKTQQESTNESD